MRVRMRPHFLLFSNTSQTNLENVRVGKTRLIAELNVIKFICETNIVRKYGRCDEV